MWAVANYVNTFAGLGAKQLAEVRSSCRDALTGLPHDHCAKYLVHRLAESCALLDDEKGLLETWKEYRSYFDGKLEKAEWFAARRRYLLADVLILARALEGNDRKMYKKMLRGLRWKELTGKLQLANTSGKNTSVRWGSNLRWWWIIWILYILLRVIFQHP